MDNINIYLLLYYLLSTLIHRIIFYIHSKEIEDLVKVKVKFGNIASGEKTIKDREIRDKICSLLKAHACNWETSSVIKTANLNEVMGISIRVITDNADEKMEKDFYNNWSNALEKLFSVLNIIFEKEIISKLLK